MLVFHKLNFNGDPYFFFWFETENYNHDVVVKTIQSQIKLVKQKLTFFLINKENVLSLVFFGTQERPLWNTVGIR